MSNSKIYQFNTFLYPFRSELSAYFRTCSGIFLLDF